MPSSVRYPGTEVAVVESIRVQTLSTATATSGRVQAGDFHAYMAIINCGAIGTSIDAKIITYDAASGGNSEDLTGAAITQLDGDDDNAVAVIEFDMLNASNGFNWFALSVTSVGVSQVAASILGVYPRTDDAFDFQSGDVFERVTA